MTDNSAYKGQKSVCVRGGAKEHLQPISSTVHMLAFCQKIKQNVPILNYMTLQVPSLGLLFSH